MAHKSDDSHHPAPPADGVDDHDEFDFEDVETSEISDASGDPANEATAHSPPDDNDTDTPDDELLASGDVLGKRYEIVDLVHTGGMSHVYKAVDLRRHRTGADQIHVAIKTMRRSVAAKLDSQLTLEREAARAQRLSHPNIINIYDFDEHDGQFYLVMEWLDGESVQALLQRTGGRRLAAQFAWQVTQGIAAGVQYAHANAIVHGDINPANVFITDTQEIKLLDFGVARSTDDDGDTSIWAARPYASPEVLAGSPPVFEDDLFSLGCVAYRLLSGRHPFGRLPADEAEQAAVIIEPISGIDEAHWDVVQRALSYSRSDRPRTADEFIEHGAGPATLHASGSPWPRWAMATPAVAVLVAAGAWWLVQNADGPPDTPVASDPVATDAAATTAAVTPAIVDDLLFRAAEAMEDGRVLSPEDDNARAFYRDVLAIDAANAAAQTGLRRISDIYVQQADAAIRAGDPTAADAVLAIASQTDAGNPAIALVNELLVAHANRQLVEARLAAAAGDTSRARQILNEVEQNGHIDSGFVEATRLQIAQSVQISAVEAGLAEADAHITAGRLLTPEDDNAQIALTELSLRYGPDPRIFSMMERLGERLLTRAAFATAGGRIPEALDLLDAVDSLGVLAPEVEAARASLQNVVGAPADEVTAEQIDAEADALLALFGDGSRSDPAPVPEFVAESAVATAAAAPEPELTGGIAIAAVPESPLQPAIAEEEIAPAGGGASIAEDQPQSGDKVAINIPKARRATIAELGIEQYVAPKFPPRAERIGQTGFVEIRFNIRPDGSTGELEIVDAEPGTLFVSSARRAVSQWRFAPRETGFPAQVRLAFDLQD